MMNDTESRRIPKEIFSDATLEEAESSLRPIADPSSTKEGTPARVAEPLNRETTRKMFDQANDTTPGKISNTIDTKNTTDVMKKGRKFSVGGVRGAIITGVTLFGGAVVADISNEMAEKRRVEREIRKQEKRLQDEQREEDKRIRKMFAYNYMDYGNIVTELWNNRTGHHKMGNSKFY